MNRIKKGLIVIKNSGLRDGTKIIFNKVRKNKKLLTESSAPKRDIFDFYKYINFENNAPTYKPVDFDTIKILWFIPDFGIGSGGHLNIFRMIFNLSKLGIKSDIAICGESQWLSNKTALEMIKKHFFDLDSKLTIVKKKADIDELGEYHLAMATSWDSAYYVNYYKDCYKKSYFVQDYEPYFYPVGSSYVFAENTYKFGFYGVTAGSWLASILESQFQMKCESFSFSYDRELYSKKIRVNHSRRVFFYARPPTDRRAFELGMLALDRLCKSNPDIEVVLAGWDTSEYLIPFKHFNPGVVALEELSDLYAQCDVALVLSFTNLSLLPLELLASGCPVVTNHGLNNSWIDNEKKLFIYAESSVDDVFEKLNLMLNKSLNLDFNYIDDFLDGTSWIKESETVKQIIEGIVKK